MSRNIFLAVFGMCTAWAVAGVAQTPARPAITALDHVSLYAADPAKSEAFYSGMLHARKVADPTRAGVARYYFNSLQYVEVLPLPATAGDARLAAVGFATPDLSALRAFLKARGTSGIADAGSGTFTVHDPEDNTIAFSQPAATGRIACFSDITCHMIHAGFLVRDRRAEDRFYVNILGFRSYWQGAMTPGKVDWVSQQVPNSHEWLEYMMTGPESDHPYGSVDRAELGGMDHISLAVENMEVAVTKLLREHRMPEHYNGPQMGRDGKWQANLYDPDGTRVELMEAAPSVEPCCSAYQAEHPGLQPEGVR